MTAEDEAAEYKRRIMEAIDALSYVDEHLTVQEVAGKTIAILQGVDPQDFDYDDGHDGDVRPRTYPRRPLPGDLVSHRFRPELDPREVYAIGRDFIVLDFGEGPEVLGRRMGQGVSMLPLDNYEVDIPREGVL